jgi:hypothetical protein
MGPLFQPIYYLIPLLVFFFSSLSGAFKRKNWAVVTLIFSLSGLMYIAEHDAQPQVFGTLPETMWWSILMMSGEFPVVPMTAVGRLLAVVMVLLGVGLFALPAGILASGFLDALARRRESEAGTEGASSSSPPNGD